MDKQKKRVMISAILLVALVGGFWLISKAITTFTGYSVTEIEDAEGFARCLTEKGAKFYMDSSYSNHDKQIMIFGSSFEYLDVIDCKEEEEKCMDAGILQVPTWTIKGNRLLGVQSLKKLAELSGCELN